MDEFETQVEHLRALAMTPGWWRYAQARALELDAQTEFAGIRATIKDRLKAAGFRPAPEELRG
ncbi:hypothetical protein G7048_22700 [Diaphorobacter sp. HDW4B]|uniref:hypothetical protein n=1 Tax=Diaphorobacter sp. HDW4B TaxID=2714925 RepID=UPI00140BD7BF|nr:hypothetical protein [Diaphorobacter sp. HDW4B]QIL72911.1 hypothetical protein G7048_22700 [Diaphorobacter sp. HDW4B]